MVNQVGVNVLKTLVIIFTIIFWVTGIGVLAVGVYTKTQLNEFLAVLQTDGDANSVAPYAMIAVGSFIIVVGLFAFWCTCKGNHYLLYTYAVIIFFLFLVQVGAGIAAYVLKDDILTGVKGRMNTTMNQYDTHDPMTAASISLDNVQSNLKCCGIESFADWFKTPYSHYNLTTVITNNTSEQQTATRVPESCCKQNLAANVTCAWKTMEAEAANTTIYQQGCMTKVIDVTSENLMKIGGTAIGIAVLQLLGVILTCCLASQLAKQRNYENV